MNYAAIKTCDIANGPGVRTSLFVSGCTHHCKGCFQPETWDFSYGEPFTQDVIDTILHSLEPAYVAGLTLLGGEPFEPANQPAVAELLRQLRARCPGKNVWAFTGFLLDRDLLSGRVGDAALVRQMLGCIDVLVDGPFVLEKKDLALRFRGSSNQRLIDVPATLSSGEIVLWTAISVEGIMMQKVPVKILREGAALPTYGTASSAGADLRACLDAPVVLAPGETRLIPIGIAMEIPEGYVGLVFARSGLASRRDLAPANKVGVVDSDYRGEFFVPMRNHGAQPQTIEPGERIAQFILTPYLTAQFFETETLTDTARGEGGFGSTGAK